MTPEQQLAKLRRAARLSWLPRGLTWVALCLGGLALLTGYAVFFVLSAFTLLAATASREAAPHWRHAIRAIGEGQRCTGEVDIAIAEYDGASEYHAIVREASKASWCFQFGPHDWLPVAGCFAAEIFYISGIAWPVLIVTREGVLFPAFEPKRLTAAPSP